MAFSRFARTTSTTTKKLLENIKKGVRYVFQTQNKYTFCITGSGHTGMEAAITNILDEGDVFMVAVHGVWGERAAEMGTNLNAHVVKLPVKPGHTIPLDDISEALRKHKPKLFYVCHGDSSTGTLQSLDGLGSLCRQHECLLLVDAVASLLAAPINCDEQGIDVLYSGSQKCLNAPAGLALITVSDKAVAVIKRKKRIASFYLNLLKIGDAWRCEGENYVYHNTPAISLLMQLHEALAIVTEKGLAKVIAQHNAISQYMQTQLREAGLRLFVPNDEHRLSSVVVVYVPIGVSSTDVRRFLLEKYQIEIAAGFGKLKNDVWRIGIMGANATTFNCDILMKALDTGLRVCRNAKSNL